MRLPEKLYRGLVLLVAAFCFSACESPPPRPVDTGGDLPKVVEAESDVGLAAKGKSKSKEIVEVPWSKHSKDDAQTNGEKKPAGGKPQGKLKEVDVLTEAGKKAKHYKPGFITTPFSVYFGTAERVAKIQMTHGLKNFRAAKNRLPKDFAELKKDIVDPAGIKLRTLPPGESYFYDPKGGDDGFGQVLIMLPEPKE